MKNISTKRLLLSLLALTAWALTPQRTLAGDDFGIRGSIEVEKKFSKRWSMELGMGMRGEQKLKELTRYDFEVGLQYKPVKFLKFSTGYSLIRDHQLASSAINYTQKGKVNGYNVDEAFWRNKNRFFFDVTGTVKWGRFKISLRERYQYTENRPAQYVRTRFRDPADPTQAALYPGEVYYYGSEPFWECEKVERTKGRSQRHYLRSRLGVSYNIKHCSWTPFASFEISNSLTHGFSLDKKRLLLGADWDVTKQHALSFAYLFQTGEDDDDTGRLHALCVGYKFSF